MKKQSITKYETGKEAEFEGEIWCCITQDYHSQEDIQATHIVPHYIYISASTNINIIYLIVIPSGAGKGNNASQAIDFGNDHCECRFSLRARQFTAAKLWILLEVDTKTVIPKPHASSKSYGCWATNNQCFFRTAARRYFAANPLSIHRDSGQD